MDQICPDKKFDYVVLTGAGVFDKGQKLGDGASFLRKVLCLLKPEGTLLFSVENRYGLRYICGAVDSVGGNPFWKISGNADDNGMALSRAELISAIQKIGASRYKLYYPVPDRKFPQLVFTDEYLPQDSLKERVVPYYPDKSALVASEKDMYDDIVENEVFPFFSNSFLVECSPSGDLCGVKYAALSTDRGPAHSFATKLYVDATARKQALYPEGAMSLAEMDDSLNAIQKRGVHAVPHSLCGHTLKMPEIQLPTLSNHLKKIVRENPDDFIRLFDVLYAEILKSSEHVPSSRDAFPYQAPNENDGGVILRYAYIDMIPINCFYDSEKGRLIFFDQEFVRENFPAGYIMYRALKYTYLFFPYAEEFVPLEQMRARYRLTVSWSEYAAEEARFVAENRDVETYKHFWEWSRVSRKLIVGNIKKLMSAK